MPTAAAKRSLNQRIKAALAVERQAAADRAAAEKRSRAGKEKVQAWLDAALVHALRIRAVNERTTMQELHAQALKAFLRG